MAWMLTLGQTLGDHKLNGATKSKCSTKARYIEGKARQWAFVKMNQMQMRRRADDSKLENDACWKHTGTSSLSRLWGCLASDACFEGGSR
ncbi:hypothetical protein IAQ61_009644, partial [Plenodomus lingam]|uniref:Predicted protein n=1 Tax=Leptosphaeria maculans (strain JN3 / isolate v23.1.3 / race Av1-4-5-6-7-8) TaxID=985895 RepID=E4ZSS7_LEPMJ